MKVLKYFFKKGMLPVYLLLSIALSLFIPFIVGSAFSHWLVLCIFSLVMLLRFTDDFFDFEKDRARREQYISKKALLVFMITSSVLFVVFNVLCFGSWGLLSALFVLYSLAEEKIELLQSFLMFLYSLYVILLMSRPNIGINIPSAMYLCAALILPVIFGIYKRSKRK